jgi:hypothetical protein
MPKGKLSTPTGKLSATTSTREHMLSGKQNCKHMQLINCLQIKQMSHQQALIGPAM